MGIVLYDKSVHPDFIDPSRKPVCPIEIDWENPLTEGLKAAYFPQLSGAAINLVTERPMPSNSPLNVYHEYGQNVSAVYTTSSGDFYNPIDTGLILSTEHSFLTSWRTNQILVGNRGFLLSDTVVENKGFSFQIKNQAGSVPDQVAQVAITYSGVAAYSPSSQFFINNAFVQLGFAGTKNSDYDYIINGAIDSNILVGTILESGYSLRFNAYVRSTLGLNGMLEYELYWDRRLNLHDIKSLYANPYQVLKPTIPLICFIPSAGGSTHEVSGTFALSAGFSNARNADLVAAGTYPISLGKTAARNIITEQSGTLGISISLSSVGGATLEEAASFAMSAGMTGGASALYAAGGVFNLASGMSNAASAVFESQAVLATSLGLSNSAGGVYGVSVSFDISQSVAAIRSIDFDRSVVLAISSGMSGLGGGSFSDSVTFSFSLGMAAARTAVFNVMSTFALSVQKTLGVQVDYQPGVSFNLNIGATSDRNVVYDVAVSFALIAGDAGDSSLPGSVSAEGTLQLQIGLSAKADGTWIAEVQASDIWVEDSGVSSSWTPESGKSDSWS